MTNLLLSIEAKKYKLVTFVSQICYGTSLVLLCPKSKNYLDTLFAKQTPPETDSKTKIQKIQPRIDKKPKITRKHQQKNTQKRLTKHVVLQNLQDKKRK